MGDDHDRRTARAAAAAPARRCPEVEVVGRLVEQQHVGLAAPARGRWPAACASRRRGCRPAGRGSVKPTWPRAMARPASCSWSSSSLVGQGAERARLATVWPRRERRPGHVADAGRPAQRRGCRRRAPRGRPGASAGSTCPRRSGPMRPTRSPSRDPEREVLEERAGAEALADGVADSGGDGGHAIPDFHQKHFLFGLPHLLDPALLAEGGPTSTSRHQTSVTGRWDASSTATPAPPGAARAAVRRPWRSPCRASRRRSGGYRRRARGDYRRACNEAG